MTRRVLASSPSAKLVALACAAVVLAGCRSMPTTRPAVSSSPPATHQTEFDATPVEKLLGPVPQSPSTAATGKEKLNPEALLAYMDARMALAGGKIDDAVKRLDAAIKLDPAHIDSRRLVTRLQFERGHVTLARQHAGDLLKIDPVDVTGNYVLGSILLQSKNKADGAKCLYRAVVAADRLDQSKTTNALIARFLLGQYLASENHINAAVEVYIPLLEQLDRYADAQMFRDPRVQKLVVVYRPGIYLLVAEFLCRMDRIVQAQAYYERAKAFSAVTDRARRGLVQCYLKGGDKKRARAEFDELIKTVPIDQPMVDLCRQVYPEDQWAERLLGAFKPTSQNYRLAITLARTLIDRGKSRPGCDLLEKLIKINPNDSELLQLMVIACRKTGQMDRCASLIVKALVADRVSGTGAGWAIQHWADKDARHLADALDRLDVPDSQRFTRAYLRGRIAESQGQIDQAEMFYRRAIELKASFVPAHVAIAELMLSKRQWADALNAATMLLSQNPDVPAMLYIKGVALAEMDKLALAANALKESLAQAPQSGRTALALADVHIRQNQLGPGLALLRQIVTTQVADRQTLLRTVPLLIYAKELRLAQTAVDRYKKLYGESDDARMLQAKIKFTTTRGASVYRDTLEKLIGKTSRPHWAKLALAELEFETGHFGRALECVRTILDKGDALWPEDYYRVLQIAAISHWRRLEYQQADAMWRQLLKDWPHRTSLLAAAGKMYSDAQKYDKAEAAFTELLAGETDAYKALSIRQLIVAAKLRQADLIGAVASIRQWIETSDQALVTLALKELLVEAWLDQKQYAPAEEYLDALIVNAPARRQLWQQKLIAVYVEQDKTDEAIDRIQKWLIESDGEEQRTLLEGLKIPVLLKAGDFDNAILLARTLFRRADKKEIHRKALIVIQCYHDAKRYIEAEAFVSKQLETVPDASLEQRRFQFQLIRTLELAGQLDRAETYIKENLAAAQVKEHWQQWLVGGYFIQGKFDQSIDLLEKILAEKGELEWACNSLGYTLADTNRQLDRAEKLIRKALSHNPGNPAYLDSLAWVLYRKGQFVQAEKYARMAMIGMGREGDPVLFDHLGDIIAARGRMAEARVFWRKSLDTLKNLNPIDTEPNLRRRVEEKLKKVSFH